jgi:ABC-type branched-subunit amino acid transport system substrate-binding protein
MATRRKYLRTIGGTAAVGALAGCTSVLPGSGGGGSDTIRFGAANPLSGPVSFFGQLISDMQTQWMQRVNENGGLEVGGEQRQVEIFEYNTESTNQGVRSAVQTAVNTDNIHMLLSVFRTGGSLVAAPILNENQIPGITHGFTPRINEPGNYLLRWTTSTLMNALPYLRYISGHDEINTVGYLVEEGELGNDALSSVNWWFRESNHDGDYVQLGRFPRSQKDFSSFISRAINAYQNNRIDALVIGTWATPLQLFLEQQGSRGLNDMMPVMAGVVGGDWTPNIPGLGSAMNNVDLGQVYARPEWVENKVIRQTLPPNFQERLNALQDLNLENQHPINNLFYSELIGIEQAFPEADSLDGPDLRSSFIENKLETLIGPLNINNKGQGSVSATLSSFSIENGSPFVSGVPVSDRIAAITTIPPEQNLQTNASATRNGTRNATHNGTH